MRARTSPTFSDSFSYSFRSLAHLHYSFITAPRFLRSLSHLFLLPISTDPCLFPDSHERSLVIASLLRFLLISSPITAVPTLAAQLAYRGNLSLHSSHGP